MGRIVSQVRIMSMDVWALFDTGSQRSYVVGELVREAPKVRLEKPYTVGIGGRSIVVQEECILEIEVNGYSMTLKAGIIDKPFIIEGKKVGVIVGATAMEEWEITIDMKRKKLNLEGLKRREFTEL